MPEQRPHHLRALYEIAVSIGGSHDLEIMARAALFAYHRKLRSVASSVLRDTPDGIYVYCCCGQGSRIHKQLLPQLDRMPRPEAGHLMLHIIDNPVQHYVFELPGFGALALSTESAIPEELIQDLTVLNLNFAAACIACVQNQRFRQAEIEAQKALSVKTEFLSNISHELRTPMNAVIGFANLLQRNTKPERIAQYADRILSSAEMLMTLINDMLDFNTVEKQEGLGGMLSFDLNKEVLGTLEPLQKLAQLRDIDMNIVMNENNGMPFEIATNAKRLAQVLTKISENAVKFCSEGDSITVSCDSRDHNDEENLKVLTFKITDTGPGIPEPLAPSLFDPFHQGDNSTQRAFQGAGLGLALCKKIVTQAGGEIVHVPTETGCEIQFTWPCVTQGKPEEHNTGPNLSSCRFLIVDDNEVNREVLRAMLDKFGSTIDSVTNGLEAVNACQLETYDLIFMDCHMPVMNGMDAAKVIRNLGGIYDTVPIIAVTADVTKECNQDCLAAGMNRFINKPMLRRTIEALTEEMLVKSA